MRRRADARLGGRAVDQLAADPRRLGNRDVWLDAWDRHCTCRRVLYCRGLLVAADRHIHIAADRATQLDPIQPTADALADLAGQQRLVRANEQIALDEAA